MIKIALEDFVSDRCLDLKTGKVVAAESCPADEVGDGAPAVMRGRRYIVIPALDEHTQQVHGQFEAATRRGSVELDDIDLERFIGDQVVDAEFQAAFNWLTALKLRVAVEVYEYADQEDPDYVWDPDAGCWNDPAP